MPTITATPAEIGAMWRTIRAANQERQTMQETPKPEIDPVKQTRAGMVEYTARQLFGQILQGVGVLSGAQLDTCARQLGLPRRAKNADGTHFTSAQDADYVRVLAATLAFEAAEVFQKEAERRAANPA